MIHPKTFGTAVLTGCVVAVVAMLTALIAVPLQYAAEARILVSPRFVPGIDPYTSSKAAERIGQDLARVVGTSQFFLRVVSRSGVDAAYFSGDELHRRKQWSRAVESGVIYNTGILRVVAYHPQPRQAEVLARAVADVLVSSGNDFAVNPSDFRIVDLPVASRYPQRPNFLAIGLLGWLGGALVAFVYLQNKRHSR